jgi:hypothetical protein
MGRGSHQPFLIRVFSQKEDGRPFIAGPCLFPRQVYCSNYIKQSVSGTTFCHCAKHLCNYNSIFIIQLQYNRKDTDSFRSCSLRVFSFRVCKNIKVPKDTYILTNIPLTIYPRRGSRGISDIPPKHPRFTKISYVWGTLQTWQVVSPSPSYSKDTFILYTYAHTTHASSFIPKYQRHFRYSSEMPAFYLNYLTMRNTTDVVSLSDDL